MKFITIFFLTIVFLISLIAPAQAERWNCNNGEAFEIRCNSDKCSQVSNSSVKFSTVEVNADDSGSIRVGMYESCWKGVGEVWKSNNFLVVTGNDLPYCHQGVVSSTPSQDIVLAIDTNDNVAVMKADPFAQPLICKKRQKTE